MADRYISAPARPDVTACDRRVRRSRAALTAAFTELAFERSYPDIGIRDVAERADVGRSTLYTHFSGIDDLLAQSLDRHLSTLARCSLVPDLAPALAQVVAHFWQQRGIARTMLQGDARLAITRLLVRHFADALLALRCELRPRSVAPIALLAEQLAAGQLALLSAWLSGRVSASPDEVARLLHRTSYAAALAAV